MVIVGCFPVLDKSGIFYIIFIFTVIYTMKVDMLMLMYLELPQSSDFPIYKWLSLVDLFTIKVKYHYYQSSDFFFLP